MLEYERGPEDHCLVVVANSASSRANHIEELIDHFRGSRWSANMREVHTRFPEVSANAEDLANTLQEGDIVVAAGGVTPLQVLQEVG